MKQRVVIIGHGFTSRLGVIRSVAEIGCYIIVVAIVDKKTMARNSQASVPIDCRSKYVDEVHYCEKKDEEGLIRLLLEKCACPGQKTILFPDSDFAAAAIDRHLDELDKDFLFPHIRHQEGAVTAWMDKAVQKELARSLGMNVAEASVIEVKDGRYDLPAGIHYPCFPKPAMSLKGDKYMKRCDTEAELRSVVEHIVGKGGNKILVEEFKEIEEEYAVLGFSDGTSVCMPGVIHFLRPSKSHVGLALQGRISSVGGFKHILTQFEAFIQSIGFVGVFDIDFFRSNGKYYFDELNLRYGGSGYAVTKMGVNLPAMMVRSFAGESLKGMKKMIVGNANAVFVNERMCLDDWYQGYLSQWENRYLLNSSMIHFVYDDEDPQPQQALEDKYKKLVFKRLIRQIIKKRS